MQIGNAQIYSSVDEFLSDPARDAVTGTSSAASIRADHFFLTASSRAPEVTLWNTPRMSVWPLFQDTSLRNAKDNLFAVCSSTGSSALPYYFTRASAYTSAASPGSSQSPTTDISLPRNTQLYNYLSRLLSSNVPGIGGKVGGNSSQVGQTMTEVFDYIRSYVNAWKTAFTGTGAVNYSYTPSSGQGIASVLPMEGPNSTHGFGRTATLKEMTMIFYAADIQRDLNYCSYTGLAVPPWADWDSNAPRNTNISSTTYPYSVPGDPSDPNNVHKKRIPYTTKVALALVPLPFLISPGAPAVDPTVRYQISGLTSLKSNGVPFFTADTATIGMKNSCRSRTPLNYFLMSMVAQDWTGTPRDPTSTDVWTGFKQMIGQTPVTITPLAYDTAKGCAGTFHFDGGNLTVNVMDGLTGSTVIQTINVTVPPGDFPVPTLRKALSYLYGGFSQIYDSMFADPGTDPTKPVFYTGMDNGYNPMNFSDRFQGFVSSFSSSPPAGKSTSSFPVSGFVKRGDTVRSVQINTTTFPYGDLRLVAGLKTVPGSFFGARPDANGVNQFTIYSGTSQPLVPQAHSMLRECTYFTTAGYSTVGKGGRGTFMPTQYPPDVNQSAYSSTEIYELGNVTGSVYPGVALTATNWAMGSPSGPTSLVAYGLSGAYMNGTTTLGDFDNGFGNLPDGPYVNKTDEVAGNNNNSSYWNQPDRCYYPDDNATFAETGASYTPSRQIASAVQFGSLPSRIDPANPASSTPWQTLLFCPNPAAGSAHPGFGSGSGGTGPQAVPPYTTAPDHVWLDLFRLPIIEPSSIGDTFSTAGKVNLNQQIMPFGGYIERTTALRAVLKPLQLAAIPTAATMFRNSGSTMIKLFKGSWYQEANIYGVGPYNVTNTPWDFRYLVNLDATIAGFKARYGNGTDVFHSASEVCDIFMVPQQKPGSTYDSAVPAPPTTYNVSALQSWWAGTGIGTSNTGFLATGDNTREAPYNHIYPLVTTKSNTYQVHYRVQVLKKQAYSDPTLWDESKDQMLGEYRGSSNLERSIDPNDTRLPDFATLIANNPADPAAVLSTYYRIWETGTKAFSP